MISRFPWGVTPEQSAFPAICSRRFALVDDFQPEVEAFERAHHAAELLPGDLPAIDDDGRPDRVVIEIAGYLTAGILPGDLQPVARIFGEIRNGEGAPNW